MGSSCRDFCSMGKSQAGETSRLRHCCGHLQSLLQRTPSSSPVLNPADRAAGIPFSSSPLWGWACLFSEVRFIHYFSLPAFNIVWATAASARVFQDISTWLAVCPCLGGWMNIKRKIFRKGVNRELECSMKCQILYKTIMNHFPFYILFSYCHHYFLNT